MTLSYEQAEQVLRACMAKAKELGVSVSIGIVDADAQPVALARMTGTRRGTTSWACQGKAMVAAIWGVPSKDTVARLAQTGREIIEHAQAMYGHRLVFLGGAYPLKDGDRLLGAVGVSGGTGAQDEEIALAGAAALATATEG